MDLDEQQVELMARVRAEPLVQEQTQVDSLQVRLVLVDHRLLRKMEDCQVLGLVVCLLVVLVLAG
jgi:hypothetical protein